MSNTYSANANGNIYIDSFKDGNWDFLSNPVFFKSVCKFTKGHEITKSIDLVKDSYVLEILGLPKLPQYSEKELETRIIDNFQNSLLELGKGFTFVGRQVKITIEKDHFYIDLVFYNRIFRCFVLFDLKIGEVKHHDLGQMQMHVNYYDRQVRLPDENDTIGIMLCKDKKETLVELTLPEGN